MKKMKRIAAALIILVMLAAMFTGCGQTTATTDKTNASPGQATAAAEKTAAPSEKAAASGGKVKLEFFQQKRETAEIINEIIKGFQADNPDITVEQNNIPDAGTVIKTRVASGDTPDVFSHWFNPDSRLLIDEGYLRDLTNEPFMKKIQKQYLDFSNYKGKNWMVPVSINFVGVYYNKDIFEKNNIQIPTTRAEFYAVCDKLKAAGVQPLQVTDKEQWTIGHGGTVIMENMFDVSKFMDVIHDNLSVKDIPGFSDYADWLEKSRKNYTQADFMGTAYEAGLGDFANGKGAMLMQGNWIIPVLKKANPNFKFGVFPFPAEKAEETKVHWGIDYTLCLSAKPKSDAVGAASLKFLDYFVNKGGQVWADRDGSISCIDGVKSGREEYKAVSDMVFAGKCLAGWFSDNWPAGCYDQFNIAQQNFLNTFDKQAFYKELDKTFKSFKDKK